MLIYEGHTKETKVYKVQHHKEAAPVQEGNKEDLEGKKKARSF